MLKRQDEMEKQHFSIASKWTTVYFFIVLAVYNFYIKFSYLLGHCNVLKI